jgi:hypothetical protein
MLDVINTNEREDVGGDGLSNFERERERERDQNKT